MKTIQQIIGTRIVDGDIGLEIEVEGRDLPPMQDNKYWRTEEDGSLRGESIEYVFKRPLAIKKVREALKSLSDAYERYESEVGESFRAGTHVHVNCQSLNVVELFNFITLYIIFENLLIKGCGKNRMGNLFCLSTSDAEYILSGLRTALKNTNKTKNIGHLIQFFKQGEEIRYSSINLNALVKYGSLEFRSMKSTPNMDEIFNWVEVLHAIKVSALKFENPVQIMTEFSSSGVDKFMSNCLGIFAKKYSNLSNDYRADVLCGVRNAQEIAFAIDWAVIKDITGEKVEDDLTTHFKVLNDFLVQNAEEQRRAAFNRVRINAIDEIFDHPEEPQF